MIHQQTPAMSTFMHRCDYCVSNSVKLIVLISFNMNSTILRVKSGCFFLQFAYCRFRVNISVLLLYSIKCWLAASVEDAVASLSVVAIYYSMLTSLTRNALILSGGRGYRPGRRRRRYSTFAPSPDTCPP